VTYDVGIAINMGVTTTNDLLRIFVSVDRQNEEPSSERKDSSWDKGR